MSSVKRINVSTKFEPSKVQQSGYNPKTQSKALVSQKPKQYSNVVIVHGKPVDIKNNKGLMSVDYFEIHRNDKIHYLYIRYMVYIDDEEKLFYEIKLSDKPLKDKWYFSNTSKTLLIARVKKYNPRTNTGLLDYKRPCFLDLESDDFRITISINLINLSVQFWFAINGHIRKHVIDFEKDKRCEIDIYSTIHEIEKEME